ncbi:uncharacterized protein LOC116132219 [Pistacia vera]|uniref:uncharacterized protein LOC116132219 n=1 Tax=Pistacia vera TaxID=55513 RepID=UPI001263B5DB|nr:uncharacterized protein LOC116132219 [Pistacia vera]
MGLISRIVLPACGSLCLCCPSFRVRSRHPIKRYKKLLSDIFSCSQNGEPDKRKISKLCEYAVRNPLRLPKITSYLEQRCYKDLRSEQFQSVKIVMLIYRNLLIHCQEKMSMFSGSLLSIINILLDQTRHDEIRVLGCVTLAEFVSNQTDDTYILNLDGIIPKLCLLALEIGEDGKGQHLCSAGLQVLSTMIGYMGEFSRIPADFDDVVSVVLENYGSFDKTDSPSPNATTMSSSQRRDMSEKGEVIMEDSKDPRFLSRACLKNMAKLAKGATTVRPVFESLFRYFDNGDHWSLQHGLALPVLLEMQLLIEKYEQNPHFLVSILIKHLDHKNILKNPQMQLEIVNVASSLVRRTRIEPSGPIANAFSDMMRHLRKSIHCCLDDSKLGAEVIQWNRNFRAAVEECLVQLSQKIGDAGRILDLMATMLENISTVKVMSKTLIAAVFRTGQIVSCIPHLSYKDKAFPEALLHQLLLAMVSADHETRIGAHSIFSVVLIPSSISPSPSATSRKAADVRRTPLRTVSVFSSSAILFEKLTEEHFSLENDNSEDAKAKYQSILNKLKSTKSRVYSIKRNPSAVAANGTIEFDGANMKIHSIHRLTSTRNQSYSPKRHPSPATQVEQNASSLAQESISPLWLSSQQIDLLLSSIWAQSISPLNMPENYVAIAHTYSLVLLLARSKNSRHDILIQSYQLALSLWSFSLAEEGPLQPSRRRSLFTLAMCMIIFASKSYNISPLVFCAKTALSYKTVDPFLQLVGDCKLQAVNASVDRPSKVYGSEEDNEDALKSLSAIENVTIENLSEEFFTSLIAESIARLSKQDSSSIREKLAHNFIPNDACPLGAQLFMESLGQAEPPLAPDNDVVPSTFETQPDSDTPLAQETSLQGVDKLLNGVSEATSQEGCLDSNSTNTPYNEIAEKQRKGSNFMSFNQNQNASVSISSPENKAEDTQSSSSVERICFKGGNPFLEENINASSENQSATSLPMPCAIEYQQEPQYFQLPPSNPFDNFLKAAGC